MQKAATFSTVKKLLGLHPYSMKERIERGSKRVYDESPCGPTEIIGEVVAFVCQAFTLVVVVTFAFLFIFTQDRKHYRAAYGVLLFMCRFLGIFYAMMFVGWACGYIPERWDDCSCCPCCREEDDLDASIEAGKLMERNDRERNPYHGEDR
mmetsp:Transcript_20881/g.62295  ORF Transcript_20881/g.62295 Transcript_20881/m.62295 type:complete len:151 (-) Transcript_20881:45-497(-)